jgi:hypothetical protein
VEDSGGHKLSQNGGERNRHRTYGAQARSDKYI